ncbi:MAG TPA: type II toxin-antitoxin system VapC family toxin [Chitinophagaceae bacterium]|nr:type II toxin-antitoxin system VapC family toxin [Chitinophagaceae bacterium]HNM34752.1 type II toxin-antitoxin system VapC family toxin [Chitinophagaceae bacterium]HNN32316.1 type II toxin-antitoxin system VapC family toxin [Chitinophagaceae bacterium]
MIVIADTTVLFHLNYHNTKMEAIFNELRITQILITRINYLELLSGASENEKKRTRKFLQPYPVLEFDAKTTIVANNLAMKYRVSNRQSKDFLIASIAFANKIPLLTENSKDFTAYKGLKLLPYKISMWL